MSNNFTENVKPGGFCTIRVCYADAHLFEKIDKMYETCWQHGVSKLCNIVDPEQYFPQVVDNTVPHNIVSPVEPWRLVIVGTGWL